jgi:hypothetical protein
MAAGPDNGGYRQRDGVGKGFIQIIPGQPVATIPTEASPRVSSVLMRRLPTEPAKPAVFSSAHHDFGAHWPEAA